MGGYLAGRLRTKWVHVHTDEVYFRDTAHGLLVWAVGLVVTAGFLASAATSIAGGAAQSPDSQMAAATGTEASMLNLNGYVADSLLRGGSSSSGSSSLLLSGARWGVFSLMGFGKGECPRLIGRIWLNWCRRERDSTKPTRRSSAVCRTSAKSARTFVVMALCSPVKWRVLRELRWDHRWQTTRPRSRLGVLGV